MENRLKKYELLTKKEDAEMTIEDLVEQIKTADGYMITVSILKKDTIDHSLITNNFRKVDMIPAHKITKDLIIKELEAKTEFDFSDDKSF